MPPRQIGLLGAVIAAFALFIGFAVLDPASSKLDVAFLAAFAILFVAIVFVTLLRRGNQPVEGHRGLPRTFWVVFASFATAFALLMLAAVLTLPFFGFASFDALLGPQRWWLLVVVAVAVYPLVRRRLL